MPWFSFLEIVTDDTNGDRAVEAKGLLLLIDYKFVALLNVMCHVLGLIQSVSAQLQSASLDTVKAVDLVANLVVCLRELRDTDNGLLVY